MNELKVKKTIFVLLPVFPLLDFFAPYNIPYLSLIVYGMVFFMFWSREFEYYILLIWYFVVSVLSIVFSIFSNGLNVGQLYYVVIFLTFSMLGIGIGVKEKYYINMLYKMVVLYFTINTCIYFFRLLQYGFDFSRVRGGITIYGGNSAHLIFLFTLFLLKQHEEMKQKYYLILGISVINAVMFVSKGAIVITLFWIVLDIIYHRESEIFSKKNVIVGILVVISLFFVCSYKTDFLSYIIGRFIGWTKSYQLSGHIMGERGLIFEFSVDFLRENPIYLFFGIGPTNYKLINPWSYSNSHNLLLDVLVDTGVLGFLFFSSIVLKTFYCVKHKLYYAVCIIYAALEGVALFFVDVSSCIMAGYAFMFVVIIYIRSQSVQLDNE